MEWLWGVGGVVVVLVAADRMVARGWFDRRRPKVRVPSGSAGSGMFGGLVEVFQPSLQHLTAEQDRRRHDVQLAGDAAPPVDLDAGIARLDPPVPPDA
ncbi:DUF6191 domain-containing protein [Cellulomonas fimi]|uniref:Uncharacterized protein n=1 Tax=Cellulomonas fimi (strain ATCC 484 / DSM 20113 / JCM 1341 / CCUG 24087 / LMG 16345 / NBRC 15513 / NCIMB 8980 / NCTC 7547 / NRS-133) TaxID=590998 RepID=F4H277_CELFA|nr:DUF6191 domain-containing protein [Cellulomonas fimi]AEE46374.1 hypothetical protein Celf_2246 [Cellulomonas fimi ATCC 484]VEH32736.1 Uncharacterised protein [Cellulomonas fimi]